MSFRRFICALFLLGAAGWAGIRTGSTSASSSPEAAAPASSPASQRWSSGQSPAAIRLPPDALTIANATGTSEKTGPSAYARNEQRRLHRDRERYRKLRALARRSPMQTSMMHEIEEASRYPRSNHRFAAGELDPVARESAPERRESHSEDGTELLTIWTDAKQVDTGAPIVVRARLDRLDSATQRPQRSLAPIAAQLSAALAKQGGPAQQRIAMTRLSDGTYAGTFDTQTGAGARVSTGLYQIHVQATENLADTTAVLVRPAFAQLTGRYRDRVEGGHLLVEAELRTHEPGDYQVFASLYTADLDSVGTAEAGATLDVGVHWIALAFHGRLMHDSGVDGPYQLGHVSFKKRAFPPREGEMAAPRYRTEAYPLSAFDPSMYNPLPGVSAR